MNHCHQSVFQTLCMLHCSPGFVRFGAVTDGKGLQKPKPNEGWERQVLAFGGGESGSGTEWGLSVSSCEGLGEILLLEEKEVIGETKGHAIRQE